MSVNNNHAPVIIEFAGPSGVGKSTTIGWCTAILREHFKDRAVIDITDFPPDSEICHKTVMPVNIRNQNLYGWRTDIALMPYYLPFMVRHIRFTYLALKYIVHAPTTFSIKTAIFRSLIRKMGLSRYLRHSRFKNSIFLVDEGLVQSVHNIHVHPERNSIDRAACEKFINTMPLPDGLIILNGSEAMILEQLSRRDDLSPKIKQPEQLDDFIRNARKAFAIVGGAARINDMAFQLYADDINSAADLPPELTLYLLEKCKEPK